MNKPNKPTELLPSSFGGVKIPFSDDLIETGYEPDVPEVLGGANLNDLFDKMGKNFEYNNAVSDAIVDLPIEHFLSVDENNKFKYVPKSDIAGIESPLSPLTLFSGVSPLATAQSDTLYFNAPLRLTDNRGTLFEKTYLQPLDVSGLADGTYFAAISFDPDDNTVTPINVNNWLGNLFADPVSAVTGDTYLNVSFASGLLVVRRYNGTEWTDTKLLPPARQGLKFDVNNGIASNVVNFQFADNGFVTNRNTISGLNAPSNRYIDLTLGVSGALYTAPANGWFVLKKVVGVSDLTDMQMHNAVTGLATSAGNNGIDALPIAIFMPVAKGDRIYITYGYTGATQYFRFIYAEGAE